MAGKSTYMYKCSMGYGDNIKEVAFCYARNKEAAREGYREIFKDKKYDKFEVIMFGEADINRHSERFMPMPKDEVDYVIRASLANAPLYAQRKAEPPQIDFVTERKEE